MSCNLVNYAFWCWPNPQDGQAPCLNLCPPRITNYLGRNAQTPGNAHELQYIVLTLDLHCNLSLSHLLPSAENSRLKRVGIPLCFSG